jgi:phosphosulfolactate phosphohydrolase-like enzyme
MIPDKKVMCPYTGFAKSCFEGVTEHNCPKWVHVMGSNPQTGETMNKFACADSIAHFLLIENSQMQRQTAAAVESFRNEMVKANQTALAMNMLNKLEGPK